MQRIVLAPILIGVILSCACRFNLEPNSFINTTESYYTVWNSPIRDGGSGYSIYLVLNEKSDLNTNQIKLQGIYFKNKYTDLKYQKSNLFQGFIKDDAKPKSIEMRRLNNNPKIKEKGTQKIPFNLLNQQAVVVYKDNTVQKYVKIVLCKKETLKVPM